MTLYEIDQAAQERDERGPRLSFEADTDKVEREEREAKALLALDPDSIYAELGREAMENASL